MKRALSCLAVMATVLFCGAAAAQRVAEDDAGFLRQAAHNGLAEVESGRLAQEKATHAGVKEYAQRMVEDHTRSHAELEQLASSKGVSLPKEPDAAQKESLQALRALSGTSFDRQYVEQLGVTAHERNIALFQRGASNARDPQIKAFAAKALPVLQRHLETARALKKDLRDP